MPRHQSTGEHQPEAVRHRDNQHPYRVRVAMRSELSGDHFPSYWYVGEVEGRVDVTAAIDAAEATHRHSLAQDWAAA